MAKHRKKRSSRKGTCTKAYARKVAKQAAKTAAKRAVRTARFTTTAPRRDVDLNSARRLNCTENVRNSILFDANTRPEINELWNGNIMQVGNSTGTSLANATINLDTDWITTHQGKGWQMLVWKSWLRLECRNNFGVECKLTFIPFYCDKRSRTQRTGVNAFYAAGDMLWGDGNSPTALTKPFVPLGPVIRAAKKRHDLKWKNPYTVVLHPGQSYTHFQSIGPRTLDLDKYEDATRTTEDNETYYKGMTFGVFVFINGVVAGKQADDTEGNVKAGYSEAAVNIIETHGHTYQFKCASQTRVHTERGDSSLVGTLEWRQEEAPTNMVADENA